MHLVYILLNDDHRIAAWFGYQGTWQHRDFKTVRTDASGICTEMGRTGSADCVNVSAEVGFL
jgi:hypothetical protein